MKKRILSVLLAAALTGAVGASAADLLTPSQTAPVSWSLPADVSENDWFADAAAFVGHYSLLDLQDGKFMANTAINRETVAETIYRFAKLNELEQPEGGMALKEAADYAQIDAAMLDGVSYCYYAGIMTGDDQGLIHPQNKITREELACVLARYGKQAGFILEGDNGEGMAVKEYTDATSISNWASASIAMCMDAGILSGNADGSFNPQGNVTRAEMAQIVYNLSGGKV